MKFVEFLNPSGEADSYTMDEEAATLRLVPKSQCKHCKTKYYNAMPRYCYNFDCQIVAARHARRLINYCDSLREVCDILAIDTLDLYELVPGCKDMFRARILREIAEGERSYADLKLFDQKNRG